MKLIGMKHREGRILAAPDWDLAQLGPDYLREGVGFLKRQAKADSPFFLYYVPNANHLQQNSTGPYAVPESIAGIPIKGQSVYSDGSKGGEREDMVLENDVIFGKILDKLKQTDDPRWPGHKMIENTLIIFTSDNGPNLSAVKNTALVQESGGLRGKKAKIWEGGHRVPFLLYWQGHFEKGINRNLLSLTDLYATLASIVGHELRLHEARDSHDSLPYWTGEAKGEDLRPRVFFCNLGSPYLNDTLAIREGSKKLLVNGGLAKPSMKGGSRGGVNLAMFYDLKENLYEEGDFLDSVPSKEAREMGERLLTIHNRGYARDLRLPQSEALILDDGWHNLRNDVDGAIGFEFRMKEDRGVTHLGMWDDHDKDSAVRPARNLPTEADRDQPSLAGPKKRRIAAAHLIQLHELGDNGPAKLVASAEASPQRQGKLEGEFRYIQVGDKVKLLQGQRYLLTMSTAAGDGDHFHDPASYDGLSPLVCPSIEVVRSVLLRGDDPNALEAIPAFSDLKEDHSRHRLPVGPTLKFQ